MHYTVFTTRIQLSTSALARKNSSVRNVAWSAAILLGLAMGTVDATIVYLVFAVAKDVAAVRGFWLLVGIFNAIMLATFVFAIHQARLVSKSET